MDTKSLNVKGVPASAVFAVVSNAGTIFQRVEAYTQTLPSAREEQRSMDDPADIMKVVRTLEGTYLTTEF
ncbi:hypothetical protein [Burkholderia sp. Ax-1719]|uniref:hypothetical protein n=1 Tax=Burkholderia sp. Ax-1719 TaxID=2608334 RepID=UPI001424A0A1|nr:hypothetical protein [Burkholderia sp. Ax-1719]NIE67437.1 hypothetical protein [Burkholderia sp. Ax-1719]